MKNMLNNFDEKLKVVDLPPPIQSFSYNNNNELIKWLKNKLDETDKKLSFVHSKFRKKIHLLSTILLIIIILLIIRFYMFF